MKIEGNRNSPWAFAIPVRAGLSNLLDVLKTYAVNFVRAGARFESCTSGIWAVSHGDAPVVERNAVAFSDLLETVKEACGELGLKLTLEVLRDQARRPAPQTNEDVSRLARELFVVYQAELRSTKLFYVANERSMAAEDDFARTKFGGEALERFHECAQDVDDAIGCYVVERDTACVMHLMRALEIALCGMAKAFGVPYEREQWHEIIKGIEDAVSKIGPESGEGWRERKEYFAQACVEFRYFKDAWRNHVMHSRTRYNGAEASRIMEHVADFMRSIASAPVT